jgi:hypothetical protein
MFKNFLLKKMLQSKLKDVPQAEQDKIFALMEKNPDLLMKIAGEAQEKIKSGMSQMDAMMAVARAHEAELKEVLK